MVSVQSAEEYIILFVVGFGNEHNQYQCVQMKKCINYQLPHSLNFCKKMTFLDDDKH